MLNLKIIACKVFYRDLSILCANSENFTDITYMRQNLHNVPAKLREALQAEINSVDGGADPHTTYPAYGREFDAILLCFGLCSNTVDGLTSKKHSLVIPRAHDCITLFLGSAERYGAYSKTHKGVYWYNQNWIETASVPGYEQHESLLKKYTPRYGEAKARKMVLASEQWTENYNAAVFIRSDLFDSSDGEEYSRRCAEYIGWAHSATDGSSAYLRDFLSGKWDGKKFLIVPPGKRVALTYDDRLFEAAAQSGNEYKEPL
jgi:hypothetical protein